MVHIMVFFSRICKRKFRYAQNKGARQAINKRVWTIATWNKRCRPCTRLGASTQVKTMLPAQAALGDVQLPPENAANAFMALVEHFSEHPVRRMR